MKFVIKCSRDIEGDVMYSLYKYNNRFKYFRGWASWTIAKTWLDHRDNKEQCIKYLIDKAKRYVKDRNATLSDDYIFEVE